MEGGHREHAQLIQRRLGRFGDVLQQALQRLKKKKVLIVHSQKEQ